MAIAEFDDAPCMLRHVVVVGDQQHGMTLLVELAQQAHDLFAAMAVERAGRLVGENDGAAVHQRARDRDALLLAAGKLARPMLQPVAQAERGQDFVGAGDALGMRHPGVDRRHFDVFRRRRGRQQIVLLEDEAEGLAPQVGARVAVELGDFAAVEAIGAAGRPVEQADEIHQGRLAGTGSAHDGDELAGLDVERDAVQHLGRHVAAVIDLDDVAQGDQRHGRCRRRGRRTAGGKRRVHRRGILGRPPPWAGDGAAAPGEVRSTRSPAASPDLTSAWVRVATPSSTWRCSVDPSAFNTSTT